MTLNEQNKKIYTFSFAKYESERMKRHKILWWKRMKVKLYAFGAIGSFLLIVGNIYPLMMWF